jgi:hypothetical protein
VGSRLGAETHRSTRSRLRPRCTRLRRRIERIELADLATVDQHSQIDIAQLDPAIAARTPPATIAVPLLTLSRAVSHRLSSDNAERF